MKKVLLATILMVGVLAACNQKGNQTKTEENMQKLELTQEWDKVFPLSDKVNHRKVTFETQYGLTLAADLYEPKDAHNCGLWSLWGCERAIERTLCDEDGRAWFRGTCL